MNGDLDIELGEGVRFVPGAKLWVRLISLQRERLLQRVAAQVRGPHGWMPKEGGVLVNLRVWENVILPLTYFGAKPAAAEAERLQRLLGALGVGDCEMFCSAKVDSVDEQFRPLIVALRTLMSRPRVVLAESGWFDALSEEQAATLSALFATECADAAWLVVGNKMPSSIWGEFRRVETFDQHPA